MDQVLAPTMTLYSNMSLPGNIPIVVGRGMQTGELDCPDCDGNQV
jgi:hypothetical protein